LGIIFGALFLVKPFGIYGLAWGVVIGALAHMIVQLLPIFSVGFKYRWDFNWRDKNVIKVVKMMAPRTVSLGISQINFLIITIVASTLAAGSLAIFNLSNNLQNFPLGVFGVSLGVAALPVLSLFAAKNKMSDFISTLSTTFRQTLFFIVPISVLLYVLRAQVVRVILGSGHFDWYDTRLTAACLGIFCLGLFAQGAYPLVIRAFYALHNTKTPFYIGVAALAVNIVALIFFRWIFAVNNWFSFVATALLRLSDLNGVVDWRVLALPAAITISSIFELLILLIALRIKIGRLDGRKILSSSWRIIIAALGGGLLAYGILQLADWYVPTEKVWGLFVQGLFAGLSGILGYTILGTVLKMEEMFIFLTSLHRRLFKTAVVMAEDSIAEGDKG
jgi:putative peptidoglycan lipid II flippase